jgi:tetratricopeptide (TPR) repeat protein
VEFADGSSTATEISLTSLSQTYLLPARQKVASVQVDPNFTVLHSTPDLQRKAKDFKLITEATFARFRSNPKLSEEKLLNALAQLPKPDSFGVEFSAHTGLGRIYLNDKQYQLAKERYEMAFRCPVRDAAALPHAYFNYGTVLSQLRDKQGAETAFKNAENADAALPYPSGVLANIATFRTTSGK